MKIVDIFDDSHNDGVMERVIYVVELEPNIFVDVMVINDGCHSENYWYIMDFDGHQAYIKTDDGDKGIEYDFNPDEVIDCVLDVNIETRNMIGILS